MRGGVIPGFNGGGALGRGYGELGGRSLWCLVARVIGGVSWAASGGALVIYGWVLCSARRCGIRRAGEACVGMGRSVNSRRAWKES